MSCKMLAALGAVAGAFLAAGFVSAAIPVAHADGDDVSPGVDTDFTSGPLQNFGLFTDQSFADPGDNEFVATVIQNPLFTDVLTSGADPSDSLASVPGLSDVGPAGMGMAGETINTFIVPSDPALDFSFALPFTDPLAQLFTLLLPLGF
jgi:hypothetical protein